MEERLLHWRAEEFWQAGGMGSQSSKANTRSCIWDTATLYNSASLALKRPENSPAKSVLGVLVDKFNIIQQHVPTGRMLINILGCSHNSIAKQLKGVTIRSVGHLWDCISSTVSSYGLPKSRKILTQWSESSRGPPRLSGTGAHSIRGEVEGVEFVQPWERTAQGDNFSIYKCLWRIHKDNWARLLRDIQQKDKGQ